MPVDRQKKDTTPDPLGSTPEQTAPALPNQQTFQQYLRELARAALRVVLEEVMREELDALIGVGWARAVPSAKDIATAPTLVIWSPLQVASRRSKCLETGKASSTPRSLNATVAMNPISPKD